MPDLIIRSDAPMLYQPSNTHQPSNTQPARLPKAVDSKHIRNISRW